MGENAPDGPAVDSEDDVVVDRSASGDPETVQGSAGGTGPGAHLDARGGSLGRRTGEVPFVDSPAPLDGDAGDRQRPADATTDDDGLVSLVGAGPGDPDLLTRRAWNRIEATDVVLHDSLTGDGIVEAIPRSVEVVDVGKRPPNRTSQEEINELMCVRARRGERVVRLKGGDPTVFGRGGEEAEYLAAEGIAFEMIPGISSVLAVPSVSGIPLTHRERASSVTVVTGHETPAKEESALDWRALAATVESGGTLVVLMGVGRLEENVRALRSHGVHEGTPAAVVQKATWDDERTVVGTLETIAERSRVADVEPPAVTVVGDVVGVREVVEPSLLE